MKTEYMYVGVYNEYDIEYIPTIVSSKILSVGGDITLCKKTLLCELEKNKDNMYDCDLYIEMWDNNKRIATFDYDEDDMYWY